VRRSQDSRVPLSTSSLANALICGARLRKEAFEQCVTVLEASFSFVAGHHGLRWMAGRSIAAAHYLGRVPYAAAWSLQQALHGERMATAGLRHVLLFLEHTPVYTLGRSASPLDLLFDPCAEAGVEVHRVERGGKVTYHGPGQAVVYPIVDLRDPALKADLHWYVTGIEETIIRTIAGYGVPAVRMPGKPGVWVHEAGAPAGRLPWRKIAAVGMACSKWVTYHGFAVNVGPGLDMAAWGRIVPCGVGDADKGVTSLAAELRTAGRGAEAEALKLDAFHDDLGRAWSEVFGMGLVEMEGWPDVQAEGALKSS